jgi:hypothetical protein
VGLSFAQAPKCNPDEGVIMATPLQHHSFSRTRVDLIAIVIGLTLAVLVRFNILPSIPF